MSDQTTHLLDVAALGLMVSTLLSLLPAATAVLSLVWIGMRVYREYLEIKKLKSQK